MATQKPLAIFSDQMRAIIEFDESFTWAQQIAMREQERKGRLACEVFEAGCDIFKRGNENRFR